MARKKKKSPPPRKGRSRKGASEDVDLEVEEEAKPSGPPLGVETGLVFVTFIALIAAFLLIQMEMRTAFGKGWPV